MTVGEIILIFTLLATFGLGLAVGYAWATLVWAREGK